MLPFKKLVAKPTTKPTTKIREFPLVEDIQKYIEIIQKHIETKGIDSAIDEFGIDGVYEATRRSKSHPKQ